ncbi:MAG TPA: cyclic pyranopterin monophosphate synthase MoaC [Bacillota bacterium]|nr:cyclic pyranopterin monophosphate synthase MoaC [Bacillota bacterium]
MSELTHFDHSGRARMVDVSAKQHTNREAIAQGEVVMQQATLELIEAGGMAKGDVLGVARVAAVMGVKQTGSLIPMCHPLLITGVDVYFRLDRENFRVLIEARVRSTGQTGVEMEALTAVTVAGLTIYDMCKAVDKGMVLQNIRLIQKTGGKSGTYIRQGEAPWEEV